MTAEKLSLSIVRSKRYRLVTKARLEDNDVERSKLNVLISNLEAEEARIRISIDEQEKKKNQVYIPELGIYGSKEEQARAAQLVSKGTEEPNNEEIAAKNKFITEDISSPPATKWYNNFQVEALTGEKVTIGYKGLEDSLKGITLPKSFGHIILGPCERNHFVSFDVREVNGEIQVIYADSNGAMMPNAERDAIKIKYPNAEIKYLGKDGELVNESEALGLAGKNPTGLMQTQFNDNDCGRCTADIVNMFKIAGGDSEKIKAGVMCLQKDAERSKEDPGALRASHQGILKQVAANDNSKRQHEALVKAGFKWLEEGMSEDQKPKRVTEKSEAVHEAAIIKPAATAPTAEQGKNAADGRQTGLEPNKPGGHQVGSN